LFGLNISVAKIDTLILSFALFCSASLAAKKAMQAV
jgi:hypothetical protein